jgi:hypothetical protein
MQALMRRVLRGEMGTVPDEQPMAETPILWRAIPQSPARIAYERVVHDGVAVLCARLSGYAENTPDGVGRVKDALDDLGSTIEPEVDVATLDVTAFSNASGDACGILTGVFAGLPCCWITHEWDQQHEEDRWDLPLSERMAATAELAITRVVEWRRAGEYKLVFDGGADWSESRWCDRGLVVRQVHAETSDIEDLWHRNRLVERTIFDDDPLLVRWPFVDRTGEEHEALRRGARLVYSRNHIIEADFCPYSTRRPLSSDWVESIVDLISLRTLCLRGAAPEEADLLRAVGALPALETLEIDRGHLSEKAITELRRIRPPLVIY